MTKKVLGKCRVCGGNVVEETEIIFPTGILDELLKSSELNVKHYCTECGIKYEFYPQDKKSEEKKCTIL